MLPVTYFFTPETMYACTRKSHYDLNDPNYVRLTIQIQYYIHYLSCQSNLQALNIIRT